MKSSPPTDSGFTLIEMLVVVAIIGVLASIALPSFKSLSQSQRVRNASFELYSSLGLARSEAIKRNSDVAMTTTMNAKNELSWVITAGGTTILEQDFIKNIEFTVTPSSLTQVVYKRSGRPSVAGSFEIDVPGATTPYIRCIKIELSGMPRIYKGACT